MTQPVGDLADDTHDVLEGELRLALQQVAQRLSLHVRHDIVEEAVGLTGVVQREYVGVGEAGGDLDLAQEPLGPEHGRQLRVQHLDGHLAAMLDIVREVHRRHAAPPELALDDVAVLQRGPQAFQPVAHPATPLTPKSPAMILPSEKRVQSAAFGPEARGSRGRDRPDSIGLPQQRPSPSGTR